MFTRRKAIAGVGAVAAAGLTGAASADQDVAPTERDAGGRLTVPVLINGSGPFFFAVDTAANASVVASDIATGLGLTPSGEVAMHSLVAREVVQTVQVDSLSTGALHTASIRLAIGSRVGLSGTDGLLGGDLLADSRIVMHFRGGGGMAIGRSRTEGGYMFREARRTLRFETPAEQRFGTLMMIDAWASGAVARAIIDSGALVSLVNTRLAEAGGARPLALDTGSGAQLVRSPTGRTMEAAAAILPHVRFGSIILRDMPVLVADLHTFDIWGVQDQPAMLIGVDILRRFSEVVIDIRRAELILEL
ncbi:MAG: pepsin/retropepsin-like aspartic protease family protein [Pseudomonadota bacterium]|nr:pepsin/retropepsin-like aspartic protease family protein [Pseudomonadota bacterium]